MVPQAVQELPMETLTQNNHLADYSGNEHSCEMTAQMGSIPSNNLSDVRDNAGPSDSLHGNI